MTDPNTPPYPPGGPSTPPPAGPHGAPGLSDAEVRQWAGLAHLGGILGFLPSLIIWLVYKDRSGFVAQEAKAALNFQITLLIGYVALNVLGWIIPGVGLLVPVVWVVGIIFSVLGYQAVNRGQAYKYPFSLELVK
ncbi:DUF4870 domain-containing protein [Actinotalea sp. BY-33]|uniref:DUF4870 domain-containing protein n=1 Tax=Actinotalea soli TaxID=2819234 RepID=A0A939LSU7_9CELL|nr:DUF4870 domain-containing protein [Actinotalea soli]MBO1750707.1 DUF4870 domain-containing protein [Actinotalea soli]